MSANEWKTLALFRESILNVINRRSRMVATLVAAIILGSAAVSFYSFESRQFSDRLSELESQGSNLISFQSSSPNAQIRIFRESCEALSTTRGVARAGLLVDEGTRNIPEIGANTPVFAASSSLFPQLSREDGLIGAILASSRNARTVTFDSADFRRLAVATRQPEGIPTNGAIVLPLSSTTAFGSRCLVELARFQEIQQLMPDLASQLVVQGGSVMGHAQLTPPTDPIADWRSRPGQFVGVASGVVGGLLASLLVWTRSNEIAAYRLSGTTRHSLALILTIESFLAAGTFGFSGAVATCVLQRLIIDPQGILLWTIAGSAAWCVSALPGTIRSVVTSPASLSKER